MVSSGAYAVQQWVLNDRIDMAANRYWQGPRPAFEKVSWRPVTDGLTAVRQVEAGQADVATEFPSARLEDLRAKHGSAIRTAPYRGTYYFAFNARKPPFNDVRVRQALSMAVERDWLAGKLLATGVRPAWGIVPPGTSGLAGYRPEWADWPRADRMKAATVLLSKAGYGPDNPLTFDIRFNSDTDHRRVAVSLAAMWKDLGVEARMLNSEASLHFASLRRGDFALARSGWIGDISVPENFLAVHKSDGGPINYSGYANPAFDKALNAALAEPDAKLRASAMRIAEAIIVEDAPVLPLYYYVSKAFVGPRITGWRDNIANVHPSRTITRSAKP
jgi:peptide/nickel transport system substrate-binding protein/oligopeptide transport system substrate-binding protein